MRLTLRTLLSYLDDTLEPAEAKLMGEKVAESEVAPELIERIAKVTRRRGLTAPPVMGDEDASADPNTVAEYLDNDLTDEQVGEFEEAALESDARLAEVSACHQILTLVLGEPAKVPPTARQRMYRLVKGKESVPYRKPLAAAGVTGVEDANQSEDEKAEADENPLLDITGRRLVVPILASLVIMLLLAGVIYLALPGTRPTATQGYIFVAGNIPDTDLKLKPSEAGKKDLKPSDGDPKSKSPDLAKKDAKQFEELPPPRLYVKNDKEPGDSNVKIEMDPTKEPVVDKRPILTVPNKPDPERRVIGRLDSKEFLLLQRRTDGLEWERALPSKDLYTADTLLSLPGNTNEVRLDSGVHLLLWGAMPEYHQLGAYDIMESRVTLHVPPIGIDADFTLESGRVFITRPFGKDEKFEPARIRVRFKDEMWDITLLDPTTEVCLDLFGYYGDGAPFRKEPGGPAPTTEVYFGVISGRAGLKLKFREFLVLEAPTRVDWESASQEKIEPKKVADAKNLEWWSKKIRDDKYTRDLQAAASFYAKRFSKPDDARIDVAFYSAMQDVAEQPGRRMFALRSVQALDAYEFLPNALADEVLPMRRAGIRCIQHWIGLAPERDLLIYRVLIDKKGYSEAHAQYVMQLLRPFSRSDYGRPEIVAALFEAMGHEKLAIRELACQHMEYCDPVGAREVGIFDAGANDKVRDAVLQRWKASWKRRFIDKQ